MKRVLIILLFCTFTIVLTSNSVLAGPMTRRQLTDAVLTLEQTIYELEMKIEYLLGTVEDEVKPDIGILSQDMADLKKELKQLSKKVGTLKKRQAGRYDGTILGVPEFFQLKKRFSEEDRIVVVATAAILDENGNITGTMIPRTKWNGSNWELSFRISLSDGQAPAPTARITFTWFAVVY